MSSPAAIRVAGTNVPRRALALFAAAAMTLGGVVFTYAIPAVLAIDVRFATAEDCTVGLLIGLVLAFLGNGAISAFTNPRRKVSRDMASTPDPRMAPVAKVIPGHGYLSTDSNIRDDLSLVFTYCQNHPYSVLMDITSIDAPSSRSVRWEVSRETLYEAVVLGRPSGEGDFRVSVFSSRRARIRLIGTDPCNDDGQYHYSIYLDSRRLRSFLRRTIDLVPIGRESEHLDIDAQLERMFT